MTLATGAIFQGAICVLTDMTPIVDLPEAFTVLGQGRGGPFSTATFILLPLIMVVVVVQKHTVLPRHVVALANNPEALRVLGISAGWLRAKLVSMRGSFPVWRAFF